MNKCLKILVVLLGLVALASQPIAVRADGVESLGRPIGVTIASGSGIVAAGTGLFTQPGTISVNVPPGAKVEQVFLYWEGESDQSNLGSDIISLNGNPVIGTLIGTSGVQAGSEQETFRADITDLDLVGPGSTTLLVSGLDFKSLSCSPCVNNGAGVLVIFDDGSGAAEIDIRDGHDHAYLSTPAGGPYDLRFTDPQTFTFDLAAVERMATLVLFVADVERTGPGGQPRPNALVYTIGGVTTELNNVFTQSDGPEWDALTLEVAIPAGASTLEVKVISGLIDGSGGHTESINWVMAALATKAAPGTSAAPTLAPTATPKRKPTATPTNEPSATPEAVSSVTGATATPFPPLTVGSSNQITPPRSPELTPTPSQTQTPSPRPTATPAFFPVPSPTPSSSLSPTTTPPPTLTPLVSATSEPNLMLTALEPTSPSHTDLPSLAPSPEPPPTIPAAVQRFGALGSPSAAGIGEQSGFSPALAILAAGIVAALAAGIAIYLWYRRRWA